MTDTNTDTDDGTELWKDPEVLKALYYEEGLSQVEVARRLGCSAPTISYWLDKLDVGPETTEMAGATDGCYDCGGGVPGGPESMNDLCADCIERRRKEIRELRNDDKR